MTQLAQEQDVYTEDFAAGDDALAVTRNTAMDRFREQGFPTLRHEDWLFTNIAPIAETPFRLAMETTAPAADELAGLLLEGNGWHRLVFVNGRYCPSLSAGADLAPSVTVRPLGAALAHVPKTITDHLGRYADTAEHPFVALNTAFLEDGAIVHVPENVAVQTPIHILHIWTATVDPLVSHPRVLVVAETGSQVTVIERYVGLGDGTRFTNPVTELIAGDNASIDHYRVVQETLDTHHVGTTWTEQGRDSNVASHTITLGGAIVRNNITSVFNGEGSECNLNGLYVIGGRQHVDNFLRVEHRVPHCDSREHFKGILDDRARAVFTGRIVVAEDAQKTDAKQTNQNLLLSPDAQVDTRPQLEILADDVKCTHGATIGQMDDEQIFYLQARGINEQAARGILLYAFAAASLEAVKPQALRSHLLDLLFDRLPCGAELREAL